MGELQVNLQHVADVILVLAVIAVAFEVALTPIFQWRIFARYLDGKGWKTPITVGLAVLLLYSYDIDLFREIIASLGKETESSLLGRGITGLLVAGGSDAVFSLFTKMKLRQPDLLKRKAEEEQKKVAEAREKAKEGQQGGQSGG